MSKQLCEIGLVNHKWVRTRHNDQTEGRCKQCKHVYGVELLDTPNTCPRCNIQLEPVHYYTRVCSVCGMHG